MWKSAGILGVEPWSFSLRELLNMVDAKRRDAWDHSASLMQLIASFVDGNVKMSDFHPFYAEQSHEVVFKDSQANKDAFKILKGICEK